MQIYIQIHFKAKVISDMGNSSFTSSVYRPLSYERMYLPLCKVAYTPFKFGVPKYILMPRAFRGQILNN